MSIGGIFGRRCESFCSQLTNNAGYYFNRFWGREKPEGFFRSGGASKQNPLVSWLKKTVKDIRGFWDGCFREGFMPQVQKAWENARRFWGDCWGVAPNGTKAVEIPLNHAETVKPDEVKIAERKFFGTTVNSSESLKAENNIISPFITEKIPPEQNVFFHEDMFEDTLKFDRDIAETGQRDLQEELRQVVEEADLNEKISPYIIHEPEIREPEPKNIIEPEPIIDKSLTPKELTASSWEDRIYQAVETGDLKLLETVEEEAKVQNKNLKMILPGLGLDEEDFLQQTVKAGNLSLLEKLLALGANPATQDELGYNAFHVAAKAGRADALEPLLNAVPSNKRAAFLHAGVDDKHLTALHLAAGEGHIHVIDALKKLGVGVNICTQHTGEAALHTAAKRGQLPALKRLKQLGAQLDIRDVRGNTPMHDAVLHDQPTSIETLHQLGASLTALNEQGKTSLFLAASRGSPESMRTLFNLTAHHPGHHSLDGWTLLHEATFDGNLDTMRELIRLNQDQLKSVASDKRGIPMDVAIKTDNPAVVKTFLDNGVTLNFDHVMQAAEMGSPAVLEELLKMRPDWLNAPSAQGSYLLHGAAFNGKVPAIQTLLALGARADVSLLKGSNFAQGSTALHMAASMGELEAAKILLEAEPNLLYRTNENLETVLHEAACQQRPEMCQFLSTQAPELLTRRDKYGKLPLDTLQEARQLYQDQQLKTIRPGEKAPKKLEVEQVHLLDNLIQDWTRKTAHLHPTVRSPIFRGTVENHFSARPKQQFNNAQSGNGVPVDVKSRFLQVPKWFRK